MLKKCLALCLALTLLGAGALAGGQIVLSAREDHPRFYSTGESGDPEAARGLRFSLGMILGSTNGELGWDVSGRPAENMDAETALRYEAGGRSYFSEPSPYFSGLELDYPLLSSFGTATNTSFSRDDLEDTSFLGIIWPLVEDAAKDAAPGDTVVRYFPLADYYDALPMALDLDLGDLWVHAGYDFDRDENRVADLYGTLSGMFSLALPAGAWARVKVELNGVGAPCRVDYDLVTGDLDYWVQEDGSAVPDELRRAAAEGALLSGTANAMNCSVADGSTLWLAAEADCGDGTRLPFVSGAAAGLYRIDYTLGDTDVPLSMGSYPAKVLNAGKPVLCWESEPGWESRTLTYIEDGQRLVLTQSRAGEETGGRVLLFDNTGTLLQVIPLFDETPDNIQPILSGGAMIFLSQSWGYEELGSVTDLSSAGAGRYVTVLDRDADGRYFPALALTLNARESTAVYYMSSDLLNSGTAWDRETRSLALAQGRWYSMEVTDQSEDPVMEIYVLNETGLAFTRRYGCDLVQPFAAENFPAIYLDDMRGIELSWQ
mgnify:CR=1 FL=1